MAADGESEKEEAALGKGHAVKESPHKNRFFSLPAMHVFEKSSWTISSGFLQ